MIKRIIDLLFGQKLASEQTEEKSLDDKKILENNNNARLLLYKEMRDAAKTDKERIDAGRLLDKARQDKARQDRILIARRALYLGKE